MRDDNGFRIKLIATDVDGVLTDGKIVITSSGDEIKNFHVSDGMGFFLARKAGIRVAIITGRGSEAVKIRAKELGIEDLYQNVGDKSSVLRELKEKYGIETSEVAYVGDDINDLPAFKEAGFKVAVKNGQRQLKECADFITETTGGNGAIREVVNYILDKMGILDRLIAEHYPSK
jgi:3-deoxy-D-manno-octulosonate 8-phosphate phosphatase (KDO 8-P phosphatase)